MVSSFWTVSCCCLLAVTGTEARISNNNNNNNNTRSGVQDTVVLLADLAPTLRLDQAAGVTVSGLSSGGYMAVQMHVAFSSVINGAAVFAGGPFYCADSNAITAQKQCMEVRGDGPDVDSLVAFTRRKESLRQVDALSNLLDDRVFLFSGLGDTVVDVQVVEALQQYYETFVDPAGMTSEYTIPAEHCLPTLSYGEQCLELASPFLGRCQVDGAGLAISALYPSSSGVTPPATAGGRGDAARLLTFDQTPYYTGSRTSLDTQGFVYVPAQCQDQGEGAASSCRLHVSFHGCLQGLSFVGDQYAMDGGFNEWADANDLVVLYPNAVEDSNLGNPNGCWDWWGYTDMSYGLHDGVQMAFVKDLIDVLLGQ